MIAKGNFGVFSPGRLPLLFETFLEKVSRIDTSQGEKSMIEFRVALILTPALWPLYCDSGFC